MMRRYFVERARHGAATVGRAGQVLLAASAHARLASTFKRESSVEGCRRAARLGDFMATRTVIDDM